MNELVYYIARFSRYICKRVVYNGIFSAADHSIERACIILSGNIVAIIVVFKGYRRLCCERNVVVINRFFITDTVKLKLCGVLNGRYIGASLKRGIICNAVFRIVEPLLPDTSVKAHLFKRAVRRHLKGCKTCAAFFFVKLANLIVVIAIFRGRNTDQPHFAIIECCTYKVAGFQLRTLFAKRSDTADQPIRGFNICQGKTVADRFFIKTADSAGIVCTAINFSFKGAAVNRAVVYCADTAGIIIRAAPHLAVNVALDRKVNDSTIVCAKQSTGAVVCQGYSVTVAAEPAAESTRTQARRN